MTSRDADPTMDLTAETHTAPNTPHTAPRTTPQAAPAVRASWAFPLGTPIDEGLLAWDLLGDGRRCETWLAWSSRRWSPVVVKVPRPDHLDGGELEASARKALAREAAAAASLAHPGIQRLLEARLDRPVPHLVFEYVEGPTVSDLLDEHGALLPADAIRLGMQVAASLHFMHTQGFVHLDVKPANIGLADGRAILMDLDLSLPTGGLRSEAKPRGTPAFMAPEQIRCEPATPSMDLYGLGATLFEAVTNVPAFRPTGEWPDRVYPQLTDPPPSARALNPAVPIVLDEVICCLMEPDRNCRPRAAVGALRLLAAAMPAGEEGFWPEWVEP